MYVSCVLKIDHNLNIFFRFTRVMYIKNQSQATEGSRFSKANSSSIKDIWSQVSMDLIGPLPKTSRVNQST